MFVSIDIQYKNLSEREIFAMKFTRKLSREIQVWQEQQIITMEQGERIRSLYPADNKSGNHALIIIFSILGALLIGGGIILILARNWEELPQWFRTMIAFLPLIASQLTTAFILYGKITGEAWREGIGLFYSISIYACIALITQIYQIPGNFDSYLLLCSLLILPVCYVLQANVPMLVYIIGVTFWAETINSSSAVDLSIIYFIGLLILTIPHFWQKIKITGNIYSFLLMWCLSLCGLVMAITKLPFASMDYAVISLYFSVLYLSALRWAETDAFLALPLKIIGLSGQFVMLFIMSEMSDFFGYFYYNEPFSASEMPQIVVAGLMAVICLYLMYKIFDPRKLLLSLQTILIGAVFLVALVMQSVLYPVAYFNPAVSWACFLFFNAYILSLGVLQIINGLKESRFSSASLGTMLITCLVIYRFFDSSLDFLTRGLAFIAIGAAFLLSNLFLSKHIKKGARSIENVS